jgi:hypothetical protein
MLAARLFEKADHLIDVTWGYMYGATLVRREAWGRIPKDLRPRLLEIARATGRATESAARRIDADAIAAMRKQGLKVIAVDAEPWRAVMEGSYPVLRGGSVPAEFFDELMRARRECRAGQSALRSGASGRSSKNAAQRSRKPARCARAAGSTRWAKSAGRSSRQEPTLSV